MRCEEFEERVNAVLDERQRPLWDAELRLHCQSCADCRHVAASYEILLEGFYELAAPEVSPDMAVRVLDQLKSEPSTRRRLVLGAVSLATAAALLIAVLPALRGPSSPTAQAPAPSVEARMLSEQKSRAAAAMALEQLSSLPLTLLASPKGSDPIAELARETGQNLANVVLYVPGIGGTKGIIDAELSVTDGSSSWAGPMSEGLRPVADSVAETVTLLLESLPVADLASQ